MSILKTALQEVYYMELEGLPSEETLRMDETLTFSVSSERKMKKLIRRAEYPIRQRVIRTAACILLAALLGGCTVFTLVPEVRASFVGWIRELGEEWFSYHYDGAEEVPVNTVYYPTWLPEGYREIMTPEPGNFVHALYENESGAILSFTYQVGLKRVSFHVGLENADVQQTTVADAQADFYRNTTGDSNVLVWTDESEGIVFWIAAPLTEEELIHVAESVRESEPMDWVYRPTWGYPVTADLISSVEQDGEGRTLWETVDGISIEFFYSKSGVTPYSDRTDGRKIAIGEGIGMLYPSDTTDGGQVLTWDDPDTGYALWLISGIPLEDMLRFAQSTQIYTRNLNGTIEINTFDDVDAPLCEAVEQALTDDFVAQIREYARRDAKDNNYLSDSYYEMVNAYEAQYISPERDPAIEQMSVLMKGLYPTDLGNDEHIVYLVEPAYFANIYLSIRHTYAHIYDENGVMIASYNSDGWFPIEIYAEMQFEYTTRQIYIEAYREKQAELSQE